MFSSLSERTINNVHVCGTPIASSAWTRSSPTKKDHLTASVSFRGLHHPTPKKMLQNIKYQPYHHPSRQTSTKHPHHHPSPIIWYDFFVLGLPDSIDLTFRAIARQQGFREETCETIQSLTGLIQIGRLYGPMGVIWTSGRGMGDVLKTSV